MKDKAILQKVEPSGGLLPKDDAVYRLNPVSAELSASAPV